MTPQQLVAAVRSKDPMHGLCESKQITKEGCDWLKQALDPFHDTQLDSLRGYPDVSTEPTVIIKVNQAIQIAAPAGLAANTNWDCHIVLSPIDWALPPAALKDGAYATTLGYNLACSSYPLGGLASSTTTRVAPAGLTENFGGNRAARALPGATTGRLDGLVINSVPSTPGANQTFTPGHCSSGVNGYALNNIVLDDFFDFEDTDLGAYRIIYSGFEVVNTTAEIAKQGAVTVYEFGNSFDVSSTFSTAIIQKSQGGSQASYTTSPDIQSKTTRAFRCPPNNLAEAKIMPGARSWAAKDGAYNVAKFCDVNPFQAPNGKNYLIQQNKKTATTTEGYLLDATDVNICSVGSFASPGLAGYVDVSNPATVLSGPSYTTPGSADVAVFPLCSAAPAVHFSQMSTSGAYFTGLSPTTTLFVTWRVGIERMPSANNPTFLSLAQPSAVYDPNALVLYNLIAANLPPGCPVGWNDMGKWFSMIAEVAKQMIPGAFPLVSAAQMILNGMGATSQARALPSVVKGMKEVANIARAGFGSNGQSRHLAAKKIQAAVQRNKGKTSVPNFGRMNAKPPTPRRR